ncbi:MAG: XRE family transcriptional regulator [Pseudonocardiales bacterium]|nr:MAG: XRE family transcriptional regulator [Pseudonocardiales bacterium]
MTDTLTIGERVAWYRRRRGMTQEVLAGLVGRTADWLGKVENNRIPIDRLSVLTALAEALDLTVGDLIAEPSPLEWTADSGRMTVPALRAALVDYRQVMRVLNRAPETSGPELGDLQAQVTVVLDAYQQSRYGYVTSRLPSLLAVARSADRTNVGSDSRRARSLLAMTYQAAAMILTKLGDTDLAWMAADRGLTAAQDSENPVIIGSLFRSVTYSLLSNGRYTEAVRLTHDAADYLRPGLAKASPDFLSIFGTLFLAGAMAAARNQDRGTTRIFLAEADQTAQRLGRDGNHFWTAFGPTNVAIHRVSTAMELGDVQVAIDLGSRVNASPLPTERRIRHAIELARAYSTWNRGDEALAELLHAEREAPEQVRHHYISRRLVLGWVRQQRGKPSPQLTGLAQRLRVA